jgi:hypothetical protein
VNAVYGSPGGDRAGACSAEAVTSQLPSTAAWSAISAIRPIPSRMALPLKQQSRMTTLDEHCTALRNSRRMSA